MSNKPFFYRITAVELCAAVMQIPAGKHQEWLTQFAIDLASGNGTLDYSKKVIAEVEQYRNKQSDLGRKGVEMKRKKNQPTLKRPLSDPEATHKPEAVTETKEKEYEQKFDLLWKRYPRRLGKKAAFNHFMASCKKDETAPKRIWEAMSNYLDDIEARGTQEEFIKHGGTWFNNWQDWEPTDET
jgi:hypothetical protein